MVYQDVSLKWAAKVDQVPIMVRVGNFRWVAITHIINLLAIIPGCWIPVYQNQILYMYAYFETTYLDFIFYENII